MKWIIVAIVGTVATAAIIAVLAALAAFGVVGSIQRVAGTSVVWGAQPHVGSVQVEDRSVGLGDARSVQVMLKMGVGHLQVTGGAEALMNAHVTYNVADWKPTVTYAVGAGRGRLAIVQPSTDDMLHSTDNADNEWSVRLNDRVPMDLSINEGAGTNDLTLGGLSLTGLDVRVGAGESKVDLGGAWAHSFTATIHSGVGDLTVRLPDSVGVRVTADNGLGQVSAGNLHWNGDAYVNDAYGTSPVTIRVALQHGIGNVTLES